MAESNGRLRLLVVDDDPAIGRLVLRLARSRGLGEGLQVTTARQALTALDGVEIVLLDHNLPDASGLELLEALRARPDPPAVVLITAHGSEALAASALRLGADDYLAKDHSFVAAHPKTLERVRRSRELRKALVAAERDLMRAERLAAIGEMTVTLHHEINNPLMAATAGVELLLAPPGMAEVERRAALHDVLEALHRIRDILRRIGDLRAARTTAYTPGVLMIDLDASGAAAVEPHHGAALVMVPDEDLARIVELLLRHAGFAVERCAGPEALARTAERPGVSLVLVLGGTGAAGAHPLGGFRPPPRRDYSVVALVHGDGAAARAAGADRVIELPFDPGLFTAAMAELVS
jgi:DNA-binding response OmpR family regulator